FLEAVYGPDVRMVERGQHARLSLEAGQAFWIAHESRGKNLDGDVAAKPRVVSAVHLAHAALAEQRADLIRPDALYHHAFAPQDTASVQRKYELRFRLFMCEDSSQRP